MSVLKAVFIGKQNRKRQVYFEEVVDVWYFNYFILSS